MVIDHSLMSIRPTPLLSVWPLKPLIFNTISSLQVKRRTCTHTNWLIVRNQFYMWYIINLRVYKIEWNRRSQTITKFTVIPSQSAFDAKWLDKECSTDCSKTNASLLQTHQCIDTFLYHALLMYLDNDIQFLSTTNINYYILLQWQFFGAIWL